MFHFIYFPYDSVARIDVAYDIFILYIIVSRYILVRLLIFFNKYFLICYSLYRNTRHFQPNRPFVFVIHYDTTAGLVLNLCFIVSANIKMPIVSWPQINHSSLLLPSASCQNVHLYDSVGTLSVFPQPCRLP